MIVRKAKEGYEYYHVEHPETSCTVVYMPDDADTSAWQLREIGTYSPDDNMGRIITVLNKLDVSELQILSSAFPRWEENKQYTKGAFIVYDSVLYCVIQEHTSQSNWAPPNVPSLFKEMSAPGEEYPQWKHPSGNHDAYAKGEKVTHNEKMWVSLVDSNVWEPGIYGWAETTQE